MLPTTESEATSPGSDVWTATSAGTGDEWLPYETEPATAPASSSGGAAVDGPTITFTTAAGHEVVLTYHDMVLLALLAGASAAAWRGMQ